jgi:hypothetical protein
MAATFDLRPSLERPNWTMDVQRETVRPLTPMSQLSDELFNFEGIFNPKVPYSVSELRLPF